MFDETIAGARTPNEKAEYIERMSRELSRLATLSGMPFLAYVLDMAAEEASLAKTDARYGANGRTIAAADLDLAPSRQQK